MTINFLNEIVKPYGFDNDYENGFEILIPRHHARLEEKMYRYTSPRRRAAEMRGGDRRLSPCRSSARGNPHTGALCKSAFAFFRCLLDKSIFACIIIISTQCRKINSQSN